MRPHPDSERVARALLKCVAYATAWSGALYRSSSPRYANKDDLLTGAGSKTAGARWNPPNSFRTGYASLDAHTAIDEALAHFVHYKLSVATAMPRVVVAVEARHRPARLRCRLGRAPGAVRSAPGWAQPHRVPGKPRCSGELAEDRQQVRTAPSLVANLVVCTFACQRACMPCWRQP